MELTVIPIVFAVIFAAMILLSMQVNIDKLTDRVKALEDERKKL